MDLLARRNMRRPQPITGPPPVPGIPGIPGFPGISGIPGALPQERSGPSSESSSEPWSFGEGTSDYLGERQGRPGSSSAQDAGARWTFNPETTPPLPAIADKRPAQREIAQEWFLKKAPPGLSDATINCASCAMALSGMQESRLAAHVQLINPQERDHQKRIWYHQFDLSPEEKDIAFRQCPKYSKYMWGVHATTRQGLAYILRDGLKAVPSEHDGAGAGFVTVRGMERWDKEYFEPEKLRWIEKSRTSGYNCCNVLVEVAWVGKSSKDANDVRSSSDVQPGEAPVFAHRVKNSAYFVHPSCIAITGLYYVNCDLPGIAPNVPEWE